MAFNYDPTSDEGRVRLLLNDVDEADPVFTDDEIKAFLALEGSNVKRAAAQAIDTNASNEALASKVIKSQDLTTDGAKLAEAMRAHADRLRGQADDEDGDSEDGFYFGIVDTAGPHRGPELTGGW